MREIFRGDCWENMPLDPQAAISSAIARNLGVPEQLLGLSDFLIGGIEKHGTSKNGLSEVG